MRVKYPLALSGEFEWEGGGAGIVKHRRSKLSYIVIGGFPLRPKLINDVYHVTVTM